MGTAFAQIPANLLVPGQYQEIDNSLAGGGEDVKRAIILACKTAAGSDTAGVPVLVQSSARAIAIAGNGSPAAIMVEAFLSVNKTEELYMLPVPEPSAGTKWSKVFTITGVPAAGKTTVAINGKEKELITPADEDVEAFSAAIVAAVNGESNMPVEASVLFDEGTATLTFTAQVKGVYGNSNVVSINTEVSGVTITPGEATEGEGSADIASAIEKLDQVRYHWFLSDFDEEAAIQALSDELESRYSATRQIGGRMFVVLSGEIGSISEPGTIIAQGVEINSPHVCLVPRQNSLCLPGEWTARLGAAAIRILAEDPAANTYDTEVPGLSADSEVSFDDRQRLLENGIATWRVGSSGEVLIERLVTSYTENSDGERDTSYLDIQVVETVDAVRAYINSEAKNRFKTWKLSSTEENFGRGAKVMTPQVWRGFLADLYQSVFIQEKKWCQDFEAYRDSIGVAVKTGSKTRLEYTHQPVLIGQFLQSAGLNQFK